MKKNTCLILNLLFAIILTSCNNPLHRTYSASNYQDDIEAIRKSDKISDEDLEILDKYIMLVKLSGNDIKGKSYEDILNKIKSFQQQNNALNTMDALSQEARRQRLSPFLEVRLQNKIFTKLQNKNVFVYTISFKNTGTFTIKTITGSLVFNNLLEKPVKNLDIFLDEDISPKQTVTKSYIADYNDENEADRSIRSGDVLSLHSIWNPEKIIFDNGKIAD